MTGDSFGQFLPPSNSPWLSLLRPGLWWDSRPMGQPQLRGLCSLISSSVLLSNNIWQQQVTLNSFSRFRKEIERSFFILIYGQDLLRFFILERERERAINWRKENNLRLSVSSEVLFFRSPWDTNIRVFLSIAICFFMSSKKFHSTNLDTWDIH